MNIVQGNITPISQRSTFRRRESAQLDSRYRSCRLLESHIVAFLVTLAAVLSADCLAVGALVLGNTFVVFADLVFLATDLAADSLSRVGITLWWLFDALIVLALLSLLATDLATDSLSRVGIALWWLGNTLVVFTLLVGLAAHVSTFLIIRATLPFLKTSIVADAQGLGGVDSDEEKE